MDLMEAKDQVLSYLKPARTEVLKWFRGNYSVELKADQSPVTIADKRVEEALRRKISRDFPSHGIIGEEFGDDKAQSEYVWTIDPIDGTLSFIQGLPLFATLIALLHRGKPVLGVIALPALGEVAWAVAGHGAFADGQRLQVSAQKPLSEAVVGTGDRYCFKMQKRLGFLDQLHKNARIVRTYPDAFGHLMAARGAIDLMVDPIAYIWDFAPCKFLVEEAGGVFANFSGNKGNIQEGSALTGNPALILEVKKLLR